MGRSRNMDAITIGGNLKASNVEELQDLLDANGLEYALEEFKESNNRTFRIYSEDDFINEFQDFCEDYDLYYTRFCKGSEEFGTVHEMVSFDPTTEITKHCICSPDGTLLMEKGDVLQIIDIVKEFVADTNKALLSLNDDIDIRRAGIAKILTKNPNLDPFSILEQYLNERYPAPPELPDFKIV
jgi:hypothetical protein